VFDMATALITGCSKGIGFETALAFGRAGYTVAATMRNLQRAPELDAWYDRVKADFGMDARGSASAAGIVSGTK
jgi:NAD(P)-dependent dehydrogenase (short-subunit alcohol dehydrogenase family)